MSRMIKALVFVLFLLVPTGQALAQESVCAAVKLEIGQTLSLERQGFFAVMQISNGLSSIGIEGVDVDIHGVNAAGEPVVLTTDTNDQTASFWYRIDSMTGIGDVAGTGTVSPGTTAEIRWLLIPTGIAAQGQPLGARYEIGATVSYRINGEPFTLEVQPDSILVKPLPSLYVEYFVPGDVYADDPFTPAIEPPVPFSFGVRVKNSGLGTARNVAIESAQPRIVENEQGLLIGFLIDSSEVNGQPGARSLLVDFGTLAPGASATGRWNMTTNLSGSFTQVSGSFTHSDELGGAITSVISGTAARIAEHDVRADLPGRDGIRDFLVRQGGSCTLYESQGQDTPVADVGASSTLTDAGQSGTERHFSLATPVVSGYSFLKLTDPFAGAKRLKAVLRSDGKLIGADNAWLSKHRNLVAHEWEYGFNLFDSNTTGAYTVIFDDPAAEPHAPVLQLIADQVVVEGAELSFAAHATDQDGTKPALSAAPLPAGARFVDGGETWGTFSWTPAVGQAGTYQVTFTASDGALSDQQAVRITVRHIWDTDGDGMADAWELAHFGSLARDGAGDADGDGRTDLQEYLAGTDPNTGLAPSVPVVLAPAAGGEVAALQPSLVVRSSVDRDGGGATSYAFEVYADAALTQRVADAAGVAQGGGSTAWTVPISLADNAPYWWRVRAGDGVHASAWAYGSFFVNTANDPPAGVGVSQPGDGRSVGTTTPALVVRNATDVDRDAVTYGFEVFSDAGMTALVASASDVAAGGGGTTSWTVPAPLADQTTYYWRATARDEHGATAVVTASFLVDTGNQPPSAPTVVAPADGAETTAMAPTLTVGNASDPEVSPLTYLFELDTVPSFNSPGLVSSVAIAEGPGETSWTVPAGLVDNTRYYWRARAADAGADGPWVVASLFVNTVNDSPGTPTVLNPAAGGEVWSTSPDLALNAPVDADGDALSYDFEVYAEAALTTHVAFASGGGATWTVSATLVDDRSYWWRARAVDEHGAASGWSEAQSFFVNVRGYNNPPTILVARPAAAEAPSNAVSFEVRWTDGDPDSAALVSLYYDDDGDGFDGTPIVAAIAENDAANAFTWDTSALADGSWWVYAVIADEENEARAYGAGPVVIDRTAPVVTASPAGGLFNAPQGVVLTASETAVIRYTTDGSAPTAASPVYAGPIAVPVSGTLRFFAVDPAGNVGPEGSETYDIDEVPPAVAIDALPALWRSASYTMTGTAEAGSTVSLAVDTPATVGVVSQPVGGTWSATVSGLVHGPNTFTATAVDPAGNAAQDVAALEVNLNQAPVLDPIGPRGVAENQPLVFGVTASDPDGPAPAITAQGLPAGASFIGGTFAWTPTYDQSGEYNVTFIADDGDLQDAESVAITVTNVNRAPTVPQVSAPQAQAEVPSARPALVLENSVDPDGDALAYEFEVYGDQALTLPEAASGLVAQQAGTTSWTVGADLADNAWHYWRGRATDGSSPTLWADGSFFVNTANEPPGVFDVAAPAPGADVATQTPELRVANAGDVDGDAVWYSFAVYADDGLTSQEDLVTGIPAGTGGSTAWTTAVPLADNAWHFWTATATDEHGLATAIGPSAFFVNTANDAPAAPAVASPADGSEVASTSVTLSVANATDVDRNPLTYFFELDTAPTFDTPNRRTSGEVAETEGTTSWGVAGLADNTRYYWHAKAADAWTESPWAGAGFFVNTANDAPSAPTPRNPGAGAWVDGVTPRLEVYAAVDPDLDPLRYEYEVYAEPPGGTVASGGAAATEWVVTPPLPLYAWHSWRARAVDDNEAAGPWTALTSFFTDDNGVDDPPAITMTEPAAAWMQAGGTFTIRWVDADPDSAATIALYRDVDGAGFDGTPIVSGLSEDQDGPAGAYAWDLGGVPPGTWHVYGVIGDGTSTRSDYAPGTITVDGAAPQTVASPAPGSYIGQVTVTLTATDDMDPAPVIHYTVDGSVPTLESQVYTAPLVFTATTTLHYFAVDAAGQREAAQGPFVYVVLPPNYSIAASAGANGSISPEGAVSVPAHGSQTFTITPDPAYRVADVVVDGGSVGAVTTYTFADVMADHGIDASFTALTANLALNKTASASSQSSSTYAASKAVDGGTSTYWRSGSTGTQWLLVDLGAFYDVSRVKVSWSSTYYARSFRIETSTDGNAFTSRFSTASGTSGTTDALFAAVRSRYVRVYCTVANSSSYRVTELEVYGTASPNLAPAADAGTDKAGYAGAAISFTGSGSDADGTIVDWSWNWGDGTADTPTQNANHTYAAAGTYTATLTVTDDQGAAGSDTAVVTVSVAPPNQPPVANAGTDKTGTAGTAISFTGAGSDADGTIVDWSWNWGDGTADTPSQNASHTYETAGVYTATLTVTDNLGASGSDAALVTVDAPPDNLALGKNTSASSSRSGSSNAPANAVDGSATTYWRSSAGGTQWLEVDLAADYSVSRVKVSWSSTNYGRSFQIQTSMNGTDYTTQYSTTSGGSAPTDVTFPAAGARYVRVYCTVANSSDYRLTELEVYP
ncbi:MAG TPA: PKD domain-containing protein [bacterium]